MDNYYIEYGQLLPIILIHTNNNTTNNTNTNKLY